MTDKQLLEQALEALQFFKELALSMDEIERAENPITAIRARLEQPEQEPDDSDINQIHEANAQVRYKTWTPPNAATPTAARPIPVQEPVAWPMEEQPDGSIIPVDPTELPSDYFTTTPPAQPAPDLSRFKTENQKQIREWLADGSFTQRAIDTMFALSEQITVLKKAQPAPVQEAWDDLKRSEREGWRYADELEQERKRLTARRQFVGLTDEEKITMSGYDLHYAALIGQVERKLKEKNSD